MADNMSKLSIDPNLVGFGFYCKSLSSNLEKWQPILWFWLMADIQDGRQHVKVVDWPKLRTCNKNRTPLSLGQLTTLTCCRPSWMSAISQNHKNGCHFSKFDDRDSGVRFLLQVPIIKFREMASIFVILGNGWHPGWRTTCQSCRLTQT